MDKDKELRERIQKQIDRYFNYVFERKENNSVLIPNDIDELNRLIKPLIKKGCYEGDIV